MIAVTGFAWAVTQWAPFTLVSCHMLMCCSSEIDLCYFVIARNCDPDGGFGR